MLENRPATEILERDFLDLRARLLDLAAGLDRIQAGSGSVSDHPLWARLQAALPILISSSDSRTEQVQQAFSRPYDANWRKMLGV